jgi:hypothetical protein
LTVSEILSGVLKAANWFLVLAAISGFCVNMV